MDSDREDGELSEGGGDSPPTIMDKLQQDRDAAKHFIKLLHSNNVTYRALAHEQLDPELLRGLYQSANLPSEPAPILPPKSNGAVSKAPAVQPLTPVTQDTPKSAASPVGRQDYIARLQAAKAAKQATAKTTTPAPATKTSQPATPPTSKPPVTDEQRARNTELIKQRLEAIKARQKPSVAPVAPVTPGSQTPTSTAYVPSFSAIPGLFMNASSTSNTPAPAASQPQSSFPPVVTPHTRPLGQSPHADQEDDSMIIDVSEDESNGSDMDIDDDQPSLQASQNSRQTVGNLPNFPSGAPPATPSNATVGTSGSQTPNTVMREKELVDKEKQLVAMRETLKRKLAEKRERDRLAAATTTVASPSSSQKPSTPGSSLQTSTSLPTRSHDGNNSRRIRRAEIQSRLPTLDAEIASNASRMAQLTKELEQLTAQNEKIARDKEQLSKELEDLGVDTEGMSHAQLRAKKDEIEGEQSSDSNESLQQTRPVVQATFDNSPPAWNLPRNTFPGLGQNSAEPDVLTGPDNLGHTQVSEKISQQDVTLQPAGALQVSSQQDDIYSEASQNRTEPQDLPANVHVVPATANEVVQASANAPVDQAIQQSTTAPSPSEEGEEVDMSVSEGDDDEEEYEPEYEPEEPVVVPEAPVAEEVEAQTKPEFSLATSPAGTQEEEAYEPPDVDEDIPEVQGGDDAPTHLDAPTGQAEAEDGAMDIATSSSDESSDDSESDDESTPEPDVETISAKNPSHQDAEMADDLAPELQPLREVTSTVVAGEPVCQSPFGRLS